MLSELAQFGFGFDPAVFREIWEWRFPALLNQEGLTIRKALEGWPLLAETPTVGGNTSRFVDSSIERFELAVAQQLLSAVRPLRERTRTAFSIAFRPRNRSRDCVIGSPRCIRRFIRISEFNCRCQLSWSNVKPIASINCSGYIRTPPQFVEEPPGEFERGKPCESPTPGMYTCDLRIEAASA